MARFKLSNGKTVTVGDNDDDMNAFLDAAEAKGIKYEPIEAGSDEQPKDTIESTPAESTGGDFEVPAGYRSEDVDIHEPEQSIGDRFLRSALGGLTAGFAQGEFSGAGKLLPGEFGDNVRANSEIAREASPTAYAIGNFAGAITNPLNKLAGAGGALTAGLTNAGLRAGASELAGRVAGEALSGYAQSGLESYADADPEDPERAARALADAEKGAEWGAGLTGALGVSGKVARAAGALLERAGLRNRVAATGLYGAQMRDMAKEKGAQYVEDLGRKIEEKGLHLAAPDSPLGRLDPRNWIPQGAGTYAENAGALRTDAESRLARAESEIDALDAPPTVDVKPTMDKLRSSSDAAHGQWDPGGEAEGGFRGKFADRIEQRSPAVYDAQGELVSMPAEWSDAVDKRRYIDGQINWNRRGGYEGAGMQEQARREVAGNVRAGSKQALDQAVDNGTMSGELRDAWRGANDDYALAAAVEDPAVARVWQEYGNQMVSLPAWSAMGMGSDPVTGIAAGALAQAVKSRGRSAAAGALGALGDLSQWGGRQATWLADHAPTGAAAAEIVNSEDPDKPQGNQQALTRGTPPNSQQPYNLGQMRGFELAARATDLLEEAPALFDPYKQELENSLDDDERFGAAIEKLVRTNPKFRQTVYPLLTRGRQ